MQNDKSGAGYGNHGGDPDFARKGGQDGAKSEDYEAEDKSPDAGSDRDEGAGKG